MCSLLFLREIHDNLIVTFNKIEKWMKLILEKAGSEEELRTCDIQEKENFKSLSSKLKGEKSAIFMMKIMEDLHFILDKLFCNIDSANRIKPCKTSPPSPEKNAPKSFNSEFVVKVENIFNLNSNETTLKYKVS
jgi:hypothetical protein